MILYSDFRRHQFDTHLIMMKVTFILRNRVTLGFHGLSKADDDDYGNQNHNNNIYNTYLRWFPPPNFFPTSSQHLSQSPKQKSHLEGTHGTCPPWSSKTPASHTRGFAAETPMDFFTRKMAPLQKDEGKKTHRPQNGSYQYLKGPSSYFCPRGTYTLPDFRKLKGETSTKNKQKFKNSESWSTGFMQNSSPKSHPTNRRLHSVAQKNCQNGWHSWW